MISPSQSLFVGDISVELSVKLHAELDPSPARRSTNPPESTNLKNEASQTYIWLSYTYRIKRMTKRSTNNLWPLKGSPVLGKFTHTAKIYIVIWLIPFAIFGILWYSRCVKLWCPCRLERKIVNRNTHYYTLIGRKPNICRLSIFKAVYLVLDLKLIGRFASAIASLHVQWHYSRAHIIVATYLSGCYFNYSPSLWSSRVEQPLYTNSTAMYER